MNIIKRISYLALLLFTCIGCDQATKSAAQQHLAGREPMPFFNGLFRFEYAENPGAFLSLGANLTPEMRTRVFTLFISLLLACLFVYLLYNIAKQPLLITFALSLYLAGGLGNLIDRFLNDGHVIDFMVMRVGSLHTGIFNVADMFIMLGVGLLFLSMFKNEPTLQGEI